MKIKPAKVFQHPLIIRVTHWLNFIALLIMVSSGMRIFNASPLFDFKFPPWVTLGGWLGGASSIAGTSGRIALFAAIFGHGRCFGNLLFFLILSSFGRMDFKIVPQAPPASRKTPRQQLGTPRGRVTEALRAVGCWIGS